MEFPSSGSAAMLVSSSNVPAFLTKLWTLVEDPETDALICWSPNGTSFHVFDQGRFSKEVLPKYFKHNNMASFVRQLNMYGFRKVVHIEQGGLVKPERDDTEFQHPFFIRGQEQLLENIKRKVTNVSGIKHEEVKLNQDDVSKMLCDVQAMRGKQESIDSKIIAMKHENEALWREVATLRQKHTQQQKVVNKLIQFLITLVQSNRVLGMKRKIPLMLNDGSSAHSLPKYSRQLSLEPLQATSAFTASSSAYPGANIYTPDTPVNSGPIISDVTELSQSSPTEGTSEWVEDRTSPLVHIKEEPGSPKHSQDVEEVVATDVSSVPPPDTPLSPDTFINSILQESEPVTEQGQGLAQAESKCLSVACLDNFPQKSEISCVLHSPSSSSSSSSSSLHLRLHPGNELTTHLDSIDSGLENLQSFLNGQTLHFDSLPVFDLFTSDTEFSVPDLDSSLASIQDLLAQDQKAGDANESSADAEKQLVQYTSQPAILSDAEDLPILLELDHDTYFLNEADGGASGVAYPTEDA